MIALYDQTFIASIEVTDVWGERKELDWERGECSMRVIQDNEPTN